MASASSAATAIYKYTYTLGRSLYVPLTSRCNSIPLPATRGPNFLLPRAVAEGLVRVRNAETRPTTDTDDIVGDWWAEDEAVSLPPYDLPLVNGLYQYGDNNDLSEHLRQRRQNAVDQTGDEIDDFLTPSIATLVEEVSSRLDSNTNSDSAQFDQVVIAGEGEPTLRMDALLAVARSVKSFRTPNDNNTPKKRSMSHKKQQSNNNKPSSLPVRVITNGLCYGVPNFGYSPYNNERSGDIVPMQRHVILKDMLDAGISQLSVALNTANRHEYDLLMEPCCRTGGGMMGGVEVGGSGSDISSALMPGTAHDIVCEFILEATKVGMEVDITGVLKEEVDTEATERLARLLLSVGPKFKKRRMVRWRQFFG